MDEAFNDLVREIRRYNKEQVFGRPSANSALTNGGASASMNKAEDGISKGCKCVVM